MSPRIVAPRQGVDLVAVDTSAWRAACRRALEKGARFCGAYAAGPDSARRWNAMFARGAETLVLTTLPGDADLPTIVDLFPAAGWDEREAHDLYGIRLDGHEPLRPLVAHAPDTESWTVPVEGEGVYEVAVGPIHAGVIESGHFRFHVVGERILLVDLRLFYKHRGLERAAQGQQLADGLASAQRACGACAVTNSVAYAQACESVMGLTPSRELRRARTLLLELERLYNHLNDIAAVCAGVGFATGNMAFAAFKERAMRLNAALSGHRFLFGSVEVGGSRLALPSPALDRARGELRELRQEAARAWREIRFAASVQARLGGVGVLDRDDAVELGAVGPVARASGLSLDTRTSSPGLWYGSSFPAVIPPVPRAMHRPRGDAGDGARGDPRAAGRAARRAGGCRHGGPGGEATPVGVARIESPRGETVCIVEPAAGPRRAAAPAHRLLRQLAGAGACDGGGDPARLSSDQQELRALLRVRGPLRRVSPARPPPRDPSAKSPAEPQRHPIGGNPSCRRGVVQRVRAGAGRDGGPALRPERVRDRRGRLAPSRRRTTGDRAGTTRMVGPLKAAYEAMPEPRLVVALGDCA